MMSTALNGKGWTVIGLMLFAGSTLLYLIPRFESVAPRIEGPESLALGIAGAKLELRLDDANTGLRSVQLRIVHRGGGQVVFEEEYPGNLFSGAASPIVPPVSVFLDPKELRLADGPATLIVTARDWSLRNGGAGNRSEVGIRLEIDTKAPRIEAAPGLTYIYRGGAATATYRIDEATASDGVRVGDIFYSGYPVPDTDPSEGRRVVFFAVAVHSPANPKIEIEATDHAGNQTRVRLRAKVFERRFPEERLSLSDRFFERVIPPLAEKVGVSAPSNQEAFQLINRDVRAQNEEQIQTLVEQSDAQRHWSKTFIQLPNSKVTSRFAEHRRYFRGEQEISSATHYGFDLASLATADVVAANRGRVLFAGELGIYGNCLLVDHGLGLTTLYAHLTDFAVQVGEMVERRQVLGRTGSTGLAGGDHLHFAILIGGTYVDPLEWWDASWIKNHVEVKLAAQHS
jgi:murein DD-endopeptidase MepM/ murein hydrolase activator NlpD